MDLDQIFEYAIDQEIKAAEFYEHSAAQIDNDEAAALFRSLARMEAAHKRALEHEKRALESIGEYQAPAFKKKTAEEEMIDSLHSMAQVLREANVELTSKHHRFEAELEAAGRIQESLLPRTVPQLPGLSISVSCSMAAQIGGDYYDFLITPRGSLALAIADVSGKGLPAALLMVAMRTLWRARILEDHQPDEVLNNLGIDQTFGFEQHDQFVTMISASYDLGTHTLTFANAGHWPPLVYIENRGVDDFLPIGPGFMPLGLDPSEQYQAHSLDLHPGSLVVLFSDGIIDAINPSGERFGEGRLRELILKSRRLSSDEIRDAVATTIFEFCRGRQEDDQTLVVLKRV